MKAHLGPLLVALVASCSGATEPAHLNAPARATPVRVEGPEVVADDGGRYRPEEILRIADELLSSDDPPTASGTNARPSLEATIDLLTKLLRDHPDGGWAEPAIMALGMLRAEQGHEEEALRAFLAVCCADLTPSPLVSPLPPLAPPDPFTSCRPRRAGSRSLGQAWIRIGEILFEGVEPGSLETAVAAYRRAIAATTARDRINVIARYKLAWSFYRLDRFVEAIEAFVAVAEHPLADELRAEAIQYVAICVAEPDWDVDGAPDGTTGLDRPEVRALLSRSAPWTRDVLQHVGDTFLDLTEYGAAIRAYDELLARFPGDAAATSARARAVARAAP